jgi:hypothetical protein
VTLVCWRNRQNLSSLTFPSQVAGVRLTEILGVLSEQADEEVDAAEVAVAQPGQPGPHFRFDLDLKPLMHPMLYASYAIAKLCGQVPEAM